MDSKGEAVRAFVERYLAGDEDPQKPADNLDYVRAGLIDSFGMMRFISALEQEFGIEFQDEEIGDSQIRTIAGLVSLVIQKIEEAAAG